MDDRCAWIGPGDRRWPVELDQIDGTPNRLWLRGDADLLRPLPRIAIVGSRAPTPYGEAQARRFADAFATMGIVVVSGLARGVDAAAHTAALDAGGATIAVLGSGVDQPWPAGELAERVAAEGLLLSEFPLGMGPRRHHFPQRNRVISGLSAAVLVIEAAWASGSLITARWAADQGRAVFALPGRIDHPMARGCHRLIREGATLIDTPEALLEDLGWTSAPPRNRGKRSQAEGELERALVGETLSANDLATRTGREVTQVLTELVELELRGTVVRAPGGLFRRTEAGG